MWREAGTSLGARTLCRRWVVSSVLGWLQPKLIFPSHSQQAYNSAGSGQASMGSFGVGEDIDLTAQDWDDGEDD